MAILKHHFWIMIIGAACLLAFFLSGLYILGWQYDNLVLPGISVGNVPMGKMKKEAVRNFLEVMTDKLVNDGLQLNYQTADGEKSLVIYPVVVVAGNPIELVHLDAEASADFLVRLNKTNHRLLNGWQVIQSYLCPKRVTLPDVSIDTAQLSATLVGNLAQYETQPINASLHFKTKDISEFEITPSRRGFVYNLSDLVKKIADSWSRLESNQLVVKLQETAPSVIESDVEKIVPRLSRQMISKISLVYEDPKILGERTWYLNEDKIRNWLEVQKTPQDEIVFGLKKDKIESYLNNIIAPLVDIQPVDATFKMEDGRVVEFRGSQAGMELSLDGTYDAVNKILWQRALTNGDVTSTVTMVTERTEPDIKTGDVNNLGIKEVLGVGVSDYSNSPTNRIKNIANAVRKLNGVLIKPGGIFSTLKYTAPFTYEGGYLPELVIKGEEIKPEIGGGLCQIGTTLFRMAMNSAMKIVERRNHALIVFHYDDPVNGNPGTDATIYDPAPDFKFLNDTDSYILIQTEMDRKRQELIFTVWGTSDGRKGSYTHPVVHKWYSYGEPKDLETDTLKPGEKKCQNAFVGADASFVYTRIMSDGKEEKITYSSHYRPLPKICMVGKDPNTVASSTPVTGDVAIPAEVVATE
jgi:vancomycin resistance protein YoaR